LKAFRDIGDSRASRDHQEPHHAFKTASQTVSVAVVSVQSLPRIINASGTVTPWEEVPVGAETGGLTAVSVNAEEGQVVRQGQILVALNDTMLRAQLHQQEAGVASAKATLAEAQAALGRSRELQAKGYLSQASLDTATARQQTAAAQLASADASRNETDRPPGPGRHPRAGLGPDQPPQRHQGPDRLARDAELFRIVRDGRLELDAEIPEADLLALSSRHAGHGHVRPGRPDVTGRSASSPPRSTPRPGSAWPASAWRPAAASARACSPAPRSRPAPSPPRPFPPPPSSIARTSPACSWSTPSNHAHFRRIDILARNADQTSANGLNAGERVVVEGAGFLGDNDAVRIAGAPGKTAPTSPSSAKR
jgi:hypothetical protein